MKHWRTALALLSLVAAGCGGDSGDSVTGPSSLMIEDLVVGTGATAAAGDTLTVNYIGTFLDGREFDNSYRRGVPYTFLLGAGRVIVGWDQGVPGMRVGGKRRLTIPSSLAYGSQGAPPTIPPNTPLRFEIELLSIAGR